MNNSSICRFIPSNKVANTIHITNFVYETKELPSDMRLATIYKMIFITDGTGVFKTEKKDYNLKKGDIVFQFPSNSYAIESGKELQYIYMSFLGTRANELLGRIKINTENCYFSGYEHLYDLWHNAINAPENLTDISSEGVFLTTLSNIGKNTETHNEFDAKARDKIHEITAYIDSRFNDPTLSLGKIAEEFVYSPKYLSTYFKKYVKMNIGDYINQVRIQEACRLLDNNISCIKDIAYLCGYNDPLYFSRVFKKKTGISPSEFKKNI